MSRALLERIFLYRTPRRFPEKILLIIPMNLPRTTDCSALQPLSLFDLVYVFIFIVFSIPRSLNPSPLPRHTHTLIHSILSLTFSDPLPTSISSLSHPIDVVKTRLQVSGEWQQQSSSIIIFVIIERRTVFRKICL